MLSTKGLHSCLFHFPEIKGSPKYHTITIPSLNSNKLKMRFFKYSSHIHYCKYSIICTW